MSGLFSHDFLSMKKRFEEDSEENPKQAVGAGESQEKEGIYRWTGGQVIIHVCVCVHGAGDYTRVCVCVCVYTGQVIIHMHI